MLSCSHTNTRFRTEHIVQSYGHIVDSKDYPILLFLFANYYYSFYSENLKENDRSK